MLVLMITLYSVQPVRAVGLRWQSHQPSERLRNMVTSSIFASQDRQAGCFSALFKLRRDAHKHDIEEETVPTRPSIKVPGSELVDSLEYS